MKGTHCNFFSLDKLHHRVDYVNANFINNMFIARELGFFWKKNSEKRQNLAKSCLWGFPVSRIFSKYYGSTHQTDHRPKKALIE